MNIGARLLGNYGKMGPRKRQAMIRLATRISNVVLPERAYSVFDKLYKVDRAMFGEDYGMANPIRKLMAGAGDTFSSRLPDLPVEAEMESLHQKSTFHTRDEIIERSVGLSPLSIMEAPARAGHASAANIPAPHVDDHSSGNGFVDAQGKYHGTYTHAGPDPGQYGWAGAETIPNTGRSSGIDKLGPSLAQTIGSGMLSEAQLKAASYNNVYSLIKMGGGSEDDHRTATFLLQRMILEGYVRGVDVERQLRNAGGLRYKVGSPRCGYSCGGWDGAGPFVDMNSRGYGSDVALLNIFYQEVGHALGQLNHTRGLMAGSYQYQDLHGQTIANYSRWIDQYFQDVGKVRFTPGQHGSGANLNAQQVQAFIQGNPQAFPGLSGQPIPDGGGTPPGGPGTTAPPNVTVTNTTITPPTVNTAAGAGTITSSGMGGNVSEPDDMSKTPVAGSLPDMSSVQAFAAGLGQIGNSPRISDLAGAILRMKSG